MGRLALVAALLIVAAGLLYARTPPPCPPVDAEAIRPAPTGDASASAGSTGGGTSSRRSARPAGPVALPAGSVGLPVRLADPAALSVVVPGARVDLLVVTGGPAGEPTLVAPAALVLDVVRPAGPDDPGVLYLGLPPDRARRAVAAGDGGQFAILVHP